MVLYNISCYEQTKSQLRCLLVHAINSFNDICSAYCHTISTRHNIVPDTDYKNGRIISTKPGYTEIKIADDSTIIQLKESQGRSKF